MTIACAACGKENPDEARFCFACGKPVGRTMAARLERKFVTVLFADFVDYTPFVERSDPEVVRSILTQVFDRLTERIVHLGGVVEKFIGDEVLALFGVPIVHEDDSERAVRAALDMQSVLRQINETLIAQNKPHLELRIGVEGGEVLIDPDAFQQVAPQSGTLTGDAVNTAARLRAAADPGGIVIGPAAYAATRQAIEYHELEPLELKGKSGRVPAWVAVGVRERKPVGRGALELR